MPRLHALPLAGALLFAGACSPAATEPPAAPEQPAAVPVAAPSAPAPIVAGAMPGDLEIYAEITGIPGLLSAARAIVDDATLAAGWAMVAEQMGMSRNLLELLIAAVESIHAGGKRIGGELRIAGSIAMRAAQPMRDLIALGVLIDAGAFGPHGRRIRPHGAPKATMVWFDGPKLLVFGDERLTAAVAAVVDGRAPGLGDAQRVLVAPAAGERRVANAFVANALLDTLAPGRLSFPAPLSAAFALWEGGVRGGVLVTAQNPKGNPPLPPPRALALARRLPAETVGYVALSTRLPGGRAGATELLAQMVASVGARAERDVKKIDGALAAAGVRLADLLGALGDEGVVGLSKQAGGDAVVILLEVSDPKPAERLLRFMRGKLVADKISTNVRLDGAGFSADLRGPFPRNSLLRANLASGRLVIGIGNKDVVERALLAVEKGNATLGDDADHARALSTLPASAGLRLWLDLGQISWMISRHVPAPQKAVLEGLRRAARSQRLTGGLSLSVVSEGDRVRLELDEVNGIGMFAALGVLAARRYLIMAKEGEGQ